MARTKITAIRGMSPSSCPRRLRLHLLRQRPIPQVLYLIFLTFVTVRLSASFSMLELAINCRW
jgi:hypothetical protein